MHLCCWDHEVLQGASDNAIEHTKAVFVSASHQTGLDTRSMTRRSIKVGIRGGGGQARAEARVLVTMTHLAHPKLVALRPHVWTEPTGERACDFKLSQALGQIGFSSFFLSPNM